MPGYTRRVYAGAAAATTITGTINSTATSMTIAAYTGWPSGANPFYVVIDPGTASEEKVLVTRTGSTDTTLNVTTRGADGTTGVSHSAGAAIYPVFTAVDADEANTVASTLTTKGDLLVHTGSAHARLPVSATNNYVLTAASGETAGLKWVAPNYGLREIVIFISSGTFTKASYTWARAIKVQAVGGGGGAGRAAASKTSGGGGGGAYAQSLITDINALDASITVTVGAAGAGATTDNTAGTAGGDTSFGTLVIAKGGSGGSAAQGGSGGLGSTSTGDFTSPGGDGGSGATSSDLPPGGHGGSSFFGGGGYGRAGGTAGSGQTGRARGSGGGGSVGANNGANGLAGAVIVEIYG